MVQPTDRMGASPTQLSVWSVAIGGAVGILVGLFVGDFAHLIRPLGDVYVLLLEVAVYPYLICSLLHGLGSMAPAQAWKLFRSGWKFYIALWGITFALLILLAQGIPQALSSSWVAKAAAKDSPSLLEILIPSDPFTALSRNYVPAVVLFCLFYGVALQYVPEKTSLLSVLEGIRLASLKFWNGVVRFAPLAVFALFADLAGTIRPKAMAEVSVFLLLFFAGAVILTFWIVPGCIAAFTPFDYKEVLHDLKSALLIVVATTLSVSALPYISSATQRLAKACGIEDPDTGEIVRTNISVAYPLGQLGNFFVYLFIVFALFFNGVVPQPLERWLLPVVTLLSCVGSPTSSVDAVTFLARWLDLPEQTASLYVSLMTLTRYGQVIASVAGFAFLSFGVVLAYYGRIRVRWSRLLFYLAVAGVMAGAFVLGARRLDAWILNRASNPYLSFELEPELRQAVEVSFTPLASADPLLPGLSVISRIQKQGELRVGYNSGIIPFCYRNSRDELVGYDVAYAYQLARDLNVRLRFVPFEWAELAQNLAEGRFDIAMAGIYVTEDRLLEFKTSSPYFQSPLALFMPRERAGGFTSREEILERQALKIGVFNDPVLIPRLKRTFPNAEIIIVPDYRQVPDFSKIDAAIWTLVQAEALAAAHPELIAVAPSDVGNPYLLAYFMPPSAEEFEKFVSYWLNLKQSDGFESRQKAYWIARVPRADPTPRWSVLRNVLGIGRRASHSGAPDDT
jgi:Na+/H+-dicarboxylate symporter/ABC-type amino acid transport substrate-binding protein